MLPVSNSTGFSSKILLPDSITGSTASTRRENRATEAARELETTFLALLLKQMRETVEGEGMFPGDKGDIQGGLFDMFLSKHLADQGGIGLADYVAKTLLPRSTEATTNDANTRNTAPATVGGVSGPPLS